MRNLLKKAGSIPIYTFGGLLIVWGLVPPLLEFLSFRHQLDFSPVTWLGHDTDFYLLLDLFKIAIGGWLIHYANSLWNSKLYSELQLLKNKAKGADKSDQYALATYYDQTLGNKVEALRCYELAARQGHPEAQFCAADIHLNIYDQAYFEGGTPNPMALAQGKYWMKLAAENGVVAAGERLREFGIKYDLR